MNADTRSAIEYLKQMAEQRFWGFISMKFENGNVVHVRREENLKPAQMSTLPEKNGGTSYDRSSS
jgi:hypothetical protein